MTGDAAKSFALITLLFSCMLLTDPAPCFSRTTEPASVMVLAAGPMRHTIKSGDTISSLAKHYGVPAAAILRANPGLTPSRLALGKVVLIPSAGSVSAPAAPAAKEQHVELRPEKAPQATAPVATAKPPLREHDLAAPPEKAPAPAAPPASPAPQANAAKEPAAAPAAASPADNAAAPAAATEEKLPSTLQEHVAAAIPVSVNQEGGRTKLALGGQVFFADQIVPWALAMGSRLLSGLLLFVIGLWIAGRLTRLLARIMKGRNVPSEIISFVSSLTRYALYLVVLIAALGQFGLNVSSLLALFGAAGLAISLALKDTLSNFASGVMLLLFRYFRVGDKVNMPGAAGAAGVVTDVDIFNTVIRSEAGDVIIVPNSKIVGNVIVVSPKTDGGQPG